MTHHNLFRVAIACLLIAITVHAQDAAPKTTTPAPAAQTPACTTPAQAPACTPTPTAPKKRHRTRTILLIVAAAAVATAGGLVAALHKARERSTAMGQAPQTASPRTSNQDSSLSHCKSTPPDRRAGRLLRLAARAEFQIRVPRSAALPLCFKIKGSEGVV